MYSLSKFSVYFFLANFTSFVRCDSMHYGSVFKSLSSYVSPSDARRDLDTLESDDDDYGVTHSSRHEVKVLERNGQDRQNMCMDTLGSIEGVYGSKTSNLVVVTFEYEVTTETPVEDEAFRNEYLPNIQELFAQSFFKDDPLCCDPSAVTARSGPTSAVSIIDNVSGVDTEVLDTIDEIPCNNAESGENCKVIKGNVQIYINDQDVESETISNALNRVMFHMEKGSYSCAHSSIGSINVRVEGDQIDFVALEIPPVETPSIIGEPDSAIKIRGTDTTTDEPPVSVSVVGVIIGVCVASVLVVGGAFKKLQGKIDEEELPDPFEANPTEDVPVEISVL